MKPAQGSDVQEAISKARALCGIGPRTPHCTNTHVKTPTDSVLMAFGLAFITLRYSALADSHSRSHRAKDNGV